VLSRHGDFTAADADFQAARDLAPNDPELDFYQGRLALEAGDPATAGRLLDHYLAAHPDHPGAWRLRALSSQAQEDFAAAAAGFGQAVAFSQAPAPALYREWVLALTSTGDRAGALDAVDQGLDRLGTEVTLLGLGTDLALAENLPDRARSYLERLPAGLQTRSPWRQRYEELRCLETQASEVANCTAPAAQPDSGRITSNAQGLP
jgi:tetratricopeptide (TPR) repeat protein